MTTFHRDDVTGEKYRRDDNLDEFGLFAHGMLYDSLDVHEDKWTEDPEAVAEELHALVDEWVEETHDWMERQDEEEVLE